MKIAFLLQRATDLKSMGPLAIKALESGHQALVFYFEMILQIGSESRNVIVFDRIDK